MPMETPMAAEATPRMVVVSLRAQDYDLLGRLATSAGLPLATYAGERLVESLRWLDPELEPIDLSEAETRQIASLLDEPPTPSARMRQALAETEG